MPFPVTPIVQTFTGADANPHGAPITALTGNFQRSGNTLKGTTAGDLAYIASSNPGSADCEVYATITTKPLTDQYIAIMLRLTNTGSIATVTGYCASIETETGTDIFSILRLDPPGAITTLAFVAQEANVGDVYGLRSIGSSHQLFVNGLLIASATDATYTASGEFGFFGLSTTYALDNMGYGKFLAPARKPAYYPAMAGIIVR